jgi:hypothetical protein
MDEEDENVAHAASYQIQQTLKFEPTEQFAGDTALAHQLASGRTASRRLARAFGSQ